MKPYWQQDGNKIYQGHVLEELQGLEPESVHCVVTSPPYWGLRDYGLPPMIWDAQESCMHEWGDENTIRKYGRHGDNARCGNTKNDAMDAVLNQGQFCQLCGAWRGSLGLEPTPELYIKHIVEIFREVKGVLRKDGTVWLNLGDSYAGGGRAGKNGIQKWGGMESLNQDKKYGAPSGKIDGLKPKDLCGIPWRVALALQADGWWLRQDIIWSKSNPMPESVTDRCTKSHEYLFLLTKSGKYFFDAEAIKVPAAESTQDRGPVDFGGEKGRNYKPEKSDPNYRGGNEQWGRTYHYDGGTVNKRSVWQIATQPMPDAHFATFPQKLVEPCILAGTSEKGCCPECGSPWERVIEKVDTGKAQKMADGWDTKPGGHNTIHREGREKGEAGKPVMESTTIGWKPTCKCEIILTVNPCTVLDLFFGSGTIGTVAHKHGRNFIGIELSKTYLDDIAIPRIEKETAQLKMF